MIGSLLTDALVDQGVEASRLYPPSSTATAWATA
jgi:hypothetical protein